MSKHTILLVDDHALVRKGLRSLFDTQPDFEVIGEASDGFEAMRLMDELKPDLVLMDLSMPKMDGIAAIGQVKRKSPEAKVLVITMHMDRNYLAPALKQGADGYLLKGADPDELFLACRSVSAGRSFVSSEISEQLIEGYLSGAEEAATPLDLLTAREMEVMKLVAEGHTNKEVGELLFISHKTVDKHRSNLMKKLDIHNVRELRQLARNFGII